MLQLKPRDLISIVPDCGRDSSEGIEIAEWDDIQRRQSTLGQQDVAEYARVDGLARRDSEAGERLVEMRVDLSIDSSIILYEAEGQGGIEWIVELKDKHGLARGERDWRQPYVKVYRYKVGDERLESDSDCDVSDEIGLV